MAGRGPFRLRRAIGADADDAAEANAETAAKNNPPVPAALASQPSRTEGKTDEGMRDNILRERELPSPQRD